ncbi:hypothetical protein ASU31_10470 [Pedobacter ginsenosidimutans]|uniref:Uncharacterized protein n=1 Tax=Pedobacter ginsenosidimutans TaxID=687842 RepID=A0A0T5VPY7_9SPHI|nr:hypothetical protein ASU31_10470 [Pedobacter ginsenosidimutans]
MTVAPKPAGVTVQTGPLNTKLQIGSFVLAVPVLIHISLNLNLQKSPRRFEAEDRDEPIIDPQIANPKAIVLILIIYFY